MEWNLSFLNSTLKTMSFNSEIATISLTQLTFDDDLQIYFLQDQTQLIDLSNSNDTESSECDFDQILSESDQYTDNESSF